MRTITTIVLLIAIAISGAGCSQISSAMGGAEVSDPSPATTPAAPILVTEDWGVVDGMLSVVVRNTTDRTLRSAEGVITARNENDVLVTSSLESPQGGCCSVVDLPPGQEYGFYLDIGEAADGISRVDVAYRDVSWAPAGEPSPNPLTARPVGLDGNGLGAVVAATVRNAGPLVGRASVQAFLDGADGEFLAVVAGSWYCFTPGAHEIRMQLRHPVPAGTTVERVVIHPVPEDANGPAVNCAGPA